MDAGLKAQLFSQGGKFVSQVLRLAFSSSSVTKAETSAPESDTPPTSVKQIQKTELAESSTVELPSTEDTIVALKDRLAQELYRVELDLQGGARILNRACDCLSRGKHGGALLATAGELLSYETNPVYGQVMDWYTAHEPEFQPKAIMENGVDHYRSMVPDVRKMRKAIMGTETVPKIEKPSDKLTLEQAKELAAAAAAKEVERRWNSQKPTSEE